MRINDHGYFLIYAFLIVMNNEKGTHSNNIISFVHKIPTSLLKRCIIFTKLLKEFAYLPITLGSTSIFIKHFRESRTKTKRIKSASYLQFSLFREFTINGIIKRIVINFL